MADVERTRRRPPRSCARSACAPALDDFGAGHAALGHLKQLDVDTLKIDCVVRHATGRGRARRRHRALASSTSAGSLGLRVVAEGVDTREAWDLLARWRCDEAQGHLLARPMPADELAVWLRAPAEQVVPDAPA